MVTVGLPLLGDVVAKHGDALASIILRPFNTAITVVLYYELRARSEGYDLQVGERSMETS